MAAVGADTGKPVVMVLPDLKRGSDYLDLAEMMARAREEFLGWGHPRSSGPSAKRCAPLGHVYPYYGRRYGR